MGKIMKYFAVIFLSIFTKSLSQNLSIVYEVNGRFSKSDSLKKKEEMILIINTQTKESLFQNRENFDIEGIGDFNEKILKSVSLNQRRNFFDLIYKNFSSQLFFQYNSISEKYFKISYSKPVEEWSLLNDEKIILGYNCYKASMNFGQRKWIAWYTNEIPISDGPYKFSGLPGLILEIFSLDDEYHYTMISLQKNTSNKIFIPKSIDVDINELHKIRKDFIADPSMYIRQLNNNRNLTSITTFENQELKIDKEYYSRKNSQYWDWMKKHDNPLEINEIWLK
ncbi:GLPGLI family protein [Chryseobacterium piscicola]|uniref:GLPGLI family protein n=2 Tax=Chryseobacterium piscicola TaxID=551459 RepID=A0A1N7LVT6_9FLAO|nr:GLPGLI family protein [Chryseobacterium piscicola]SIS77940.1 GLPGLI family protein [Chryseobacterium piscicola]